MRKQITVIAQVSRLIAAVLQQGGGSCGGEGAARPVPPLQRRAITARAPYRTLIRRGISLSLSLSRLVRGRWWRLLICRWNAVKWQRWVTGGNVACNLLHSVAAVAAAAALVAVSLGRSNAKSKIKHFHLADCSETALKLH